MDLLNLIGLVLLYNYNEVDGGKPSEVAGSWEDFLRPDWSAWGFSDVPRHRDNSCE